MIKTNIKMRVNPEQSAKVQEICFKNGLDWKSKLKDKTLTCINEPFIFVKEDKHLTWLTKLEESDFMKAEDEEIDPELFIRTNGSYIEKEEFTYPMWFKNKHYDIIVRFDKLNQCKVVKSNDKEFPFGLINRLSNHTNTEIWEQVENPDLVIDIDNNKAKNPNSKHYELWENFEAIDVIKLALTDEEYKGFLKGNILKYRLRVGKKDDVSKEIEKIKDYERELNK